MLDISRNSVKGKRKEAEELVILPTSHQSSHHDGGLKDSGKKRTFASVVAPLSGDANIRVWEYSHDAVKWMHRALKNRPELQDLSDDALADWLQTHAPVGSMVAEGQKLQPTTKTIARGSSMAFLASLLHAGSALSVRETRLNYRMHLYVIRSGFEKNFKHGAAHVLHKFLQRCCAKWEGGDYDV